MLQLGSSQLGAAHHHPAGHRVRAPTAAPPRVLPPCPSAELAHACAPARRRPLQHHQVARGPRRRGLRVGAAAPQPAGATAPPAEQLLRSFQVLQDPAKSNQPYSRAVQDFVNTALLLYECGYNDASLGEELRQLSSGGRVGPDAGAIAPGVADAPSSEAAAAAAAAAAGVGAGGVGGGGVGAVVDSEAEACLVVLGLVWITLIKSPRALKRWATAAPVGEERLALWGGFVAMIVDGYFTKRMAWYDLGKLQLELAAVHAAGTPPREVVAEYTRIVFATLEKVHPQFPTR